jgi:hypothetical protein
MLSLEPLRSADKIQRRNRILVKKLDIYYVSLKNGVPQGAILSPISDIFKSDVSG